MTAKDTPKNDPLSQRVAWYDFCFDRFPNTWEATAYSLSENVGKLEFNSRHGYEGRIAWQRLKRDPDIEHIMNDFHARFLSSNSADGGMAFEQLKFKQVGRFRVGFYRKGEPCQAVTYLENSQTLILSVFPEYSSTWLGQMLEPSLLSFTPNTDETWRQWALFGLDLQLPPDFQPDKVNALPADVTFHFENQKNNAKVTAHRWGLPGILLKHHSLERFYRMLIAKKEVKKIETEACRFQGCEAVKATFKQRGTEGMDKLMGAYWQGNGIIWHNQDEQRIYAIEQVGPKKFEQLDVNDVFHF